MAEHLVSQFGYAGIALILILGGLGLPIPEEAPIVVAAVLARNGKLWWPFALASCLVGVLLGDLVVYFLGYFNGERVLSLPVTRRLLTRQRERQIKGYFHRHGFKILVSGRFVPGFRTAAYLTAGILKLPMLKLVLTDLVAASLSTLLMFGLGYVLAHQFEAGIRTVQTWLSVFAALGLAIWLFYRYYEARQRAGQPIGPPVLDVDEVPLPGADSRALLPPPAATQATGADGSAARATAQGAASLPAPPGAAPPGAPHPEKTAVRGPKSAAALAHDAVAVEVETVASQPQVEWPSR